MMKKPLLTALFLLLSGQPSIAEVRITRSIEAPVTGSSSLHGYKIDRGHAIALKATYNGIGIKASQSVHDFTGYSIPAYSEIRAMVIAQKELTPSVSIGIAAGKDFIGAKYAAATGEAFAEVRKPVIGRVSLVGSIGYAFTSDCPSVGLKTADGAYASAGIQITK